MAEVMDEIDAARAFVARDDSFDSAQALRVALRRLLFLDDVRYTVLLQAWARGGHGLL